MKSSLTMNFSVDKENRTINVQREFAAPVDKVWAAWTESELLDQWWAPKPWKARTKTMDFSDGGHWLYAMVGPEGEENWCRADFKSISSLKSFHAAQNFCDEKGNINKEFPTAYWTNEFNQTGSSTMVTIAIRYETVEDLEKYIELGFKEGFTAAMENLDEIFDV